MEVIELEPESPSPQDMVKGRLTVGMSRGLLLPRQGRASAFDVDDASMASLREGLPGWQINDVRGGTVTSLPRAWNPGAVDLLVVGVRANVAETLGLCRFLAFCSAYSQDARHVTAATSDPRENQTRRADAPLLVLVSHGQEAFVRAALEAGAHSCLILPICAKEVARMLIRTRAGNQPGRHTLNLEQAQSEDSWRDNGGQG